MDFLHVPPVLSKDLSSFSSISSRRSLSSSHTPSNRKIRNNIVKRKPTKLAHAVNMTSELDLVSPEIPEDAYTGLSELTKLIDDNYTKYSKWTLVRDFERIAYLRYFKYNAVVLNAEDSAQMQHSALRKSLLACIREGSWLAINFDFNVVRLQPYYEPGYFVREVLDPLKLFTQEVLH